jgi:glycine cleavage system H lipoate-binding protein
MKKTICLLINLLLMSSGSLFSTIRGNSLSPGDSVKMLVTPDLYNISVRWADGYNRLVPREGIRVAQLSDASAFEAAIRKGGIGFTSGGNVQLLNNESLWKMVVGRDIFVAVINAGNPFMEEIYRKGVSPAALARFLGDEKSRNWGTLLQSGLTTHAGYLCINDETAIRSLSEYLKTGRVRIEGDKPLNGEELVSRLQKDLYSVGFCRLIDVIDQGNQALKTNIRLLPADRNGNGVIDFNEKIYDNLSDFSRGVWIGKYPRELYSNIYFLSTIQPGTGAEASFLKWVLTDGQEYLAAGGYSDLLASERQSALDKINTATLSSGTAAVYNPVLLKIILIMAGGVILFLVIDMLFRRVRRKSVQVRNEGSARHPALDENSLLIPGGLYFDKTHTWAFLEQDGNVKVGIDDFLQHITGPITKIKLKSPGKKVKKGEQILTIIQNGKQLNLYSPVSGTITGQNISLESNSSALNYSPYKEGWIYKIEPANWSRESQLLFMGEKQREFIKRELFRLKDFLTDAVNRYSGKYSGVILQDGGEISDGVLSEMGPEVWEDFQTNFIDPSRQVWFYEIV